MPQRKTKCIACGNFVLVRTRPTDKKRVLVTEEQAHLLEEQWSIAADRARLLSMNREGYDEERERLRAKFGGEPRPEDVLWGLLNRERVHYAQEWKWGLYRNATFGMGEVLRIENRPSEALRFFLEVCCFDLNGPSNSGFISDPDLRRRYPPFTPDPHGIAPGVLGRVSTLQSALLLSDPDLHARFLEVATELTQRLGLPLAPDDACSHFTRSINSCA